MLLIVVCAAAVLRARSASRAKDRVAAEPAVVVAAPAAAPAAPAPTPGVVVDRVMHPARTRPGKTPERLAADAIHAGDRKKAATLYADLAAQSPDNAAFAAIARILAAE